ncbi:MAG: hypothetical protein JNM52_01085 [Betaproteobacteria bacterium]|nr:hypothetical protein [Betaproteobacteria bacterium]
MRRAGTIRLTEVAKDWASTLLAFFIRQLYDWPGGVLLGLPMYFSGYLFRHHWVIGAMAIFLLWGAAIIWIAHAAGGNDGRREPLT